MKQILMLCLIGMGLLLPTTKISSAGYSFFHRSVDVNIEGRSLLASSDTEDGPLTEIDIYNNSTKELIESRACSGYSWTLNLSSFAKGD